MSIYIEGDLHKISRIDAEIQEYKLKIKDLQESKKEIETRITNYLKTVGENALESQDLIVRLETREQHKRIQKTKMAEILRRNGLSEHIISECLYKNQGSVEKLKVQRKKF